MGTHTPGPWTVSELDALGEPSEFYIFIEPGVAVIERKIAGGDQHDMPDARLIAAAPELFEALVALMEYAGIIEERCDSVATNKARDAIYKATGE